MPNKKLTDLEIVKALKDLTKCNNNVIDCDHCSLSMFFPRCPEQIGELSLDLINRLQAQVKKCEKVEHFADKTIATLQAENEDYKALYEGLEAEHIETIKAIKHCKAEAYKECIEKAKNEIDTQPHSRSLEASGERFRIHKILNNLLKELVGEDNESKN